MSLGTKIFVSKIFSYDKNKMLFYEDFWFMWLKLKFYAKNRPFSSFSYVMAKMGLESLNKLQISANKSKNLINTHHMRVIWENFWDKNFAPLGHTWGAFGASRLISSWVFSGCWHGIKTTQTSPDCCAFYCCCIHLQVPVFVDVYALYLWLKLKTSK